MSSGTNLHKFEFVYLATALGGMAAATAALIARHQVSLTSQQRKRFQNNFLRTYRQYSTAGQDMGASTVQMISIMT